MAVKDEVTSSKVDEAATFRVNVKLVLARVVVRDSKGNALGNLRKEDFELFDNGKPQVISHFDAEHNKPETTGPEDGNGTEATKAAEQPAVPARYVAYLFDDTHLTFENINQVREAAERRVNALPPTERAAIFSTSGQTMLDFTDDRAKLRQTLEKLQPRPSLGGGITTCPDISLYLADLIVNKNDPEATQVAINDYLNCTQGMTTNLPPNLAASAGNFVRGLAMQNLQIGEEDSRQALGVLKNAVRRILQMPGQRHLVLVSPGFLTPELEYEYNDVIDRALRGQVVIGALDARGLYTVIPFGDASHVGRPDTDIRSQTFTPTSRTQFDIQAASIEGDILATLAYSTGGAFFHNNNDMDEGFRRVAACSGLLVRSRLHSAES